MVVYLKLLPVTLFFSVSNLVFCNTVKSKEEIFRTVSNRTELVNPTARVILRYNTDINAIETKGSEMIIQDVPNSVVTLHENSMDNSSIYLECVASYPVYWYYEGDGYPEALSFAETRRNFSNFHDPSTYQFTAIVHLVRVKEANTGKYTCMKIGNDRYSVFYYLFVTGEDIFLDFIKPNVRAEENDSKVVLPCRVTDPTINVFLGKYDANSGLKQFYPDNSSLNYDSRIGFTMDISKYENPWGLYICNPNKAAKAFKTRLLPPKSQEIKAEPPQSLVPINLIKSQTFKCEAKEKFFMSITGDDFPTVKYERNESSQFPYIASVEIAKPGKFSNHTVITCASAPGNKELHRWEYTIYQKKELTFSYDRKIQSFLCCTNSPRLPEMYLVPMCSSIMECRIQKHCAKTKKYPCVEKANKTVVGIPAGCAAFPIRADTGHHSGMFICSIGEAEDENRMDKEFYFSFVDGKPVWDFNDQNIPTDDILRITKVRSGPMYVNEEIEVFCSPNRFFFSKGHVWAFERKNGSISLVPKDLVKETLVKNMGLLPSTKIHTLMFPDIDIIKLYCFAPLWSSATQWRNTSISVTVLDDI